MEDILRKITDQTRTDLIERKKHCSLSDLRQMNHYTRPVLSLVDALRNGSGIIAEHKRRSPSKGSFNNPASLSDIVTGYQKVGASAISCLTDAPFFGGTLQDLQDARRQLDIPLLRKDFIIDLYQVHEARAFGADAILLIVACLNNEEIATLATEAFLLNLNVLFEAHNLDELNRLKSISTFYDKSKYAIGVNNRDLKRFKTSVQTSHDLLPYFPEDVVAVSESGLNNPEVVAGLKQAGFTGFLIGEHFMRHDDPGKACANFIEEIGYRFHSNSGSSSSSSSSSL